METGKILDSTRVGSAFLDDRDPDSAIIVSNLKFNTLTTSELAYDRAMIEWLNFASIKRYAVRKPIIATLSTNVAAEAQK